MSDKLPAQQCCRVGCKNPAMKGISDYCQTHKAEVDNNEAFKKWWKDSKERESFVNGYGLSDYDMKAAYLAGRTQGIDEAADRIQVYIENRPTNEKGLLIAEECKIYVEELKEKL